MSTEHRLVVRAADPLAEIAVRNSAYRQVGQAVGRFDQALSAGLYEIVVGVGGSVETRLVALDRDRDESFGEVRFLSPAPASRAKGAEDWDRIAAEFASQPRIMTGGGGAGLFILVRDRPGRAPVAGSPAMGLSLRGPSLPAPIELGAMPLDSSGRVSVAALEVAPGAYRMRLTLPDGTTRERSLVASQNWTTQCFIVRRPFRVGPAPDLDHGVVSLYYDRDFHPDIERARLAETARHALANNRKVTDAALDALMKLKIEDPMLGLFVAHLLLRDQPDHGALPIVLDNLARMLGPDHPDVRALLLGSPLAPAGPITEMPMLRASWDRIVSHSIDAPWLVPPGSPAIEIACRLLPSRPWLVWEAPDAPQRRGDAKLGALRTYLKAAEKPESGGSEVELESFGFENATPGPGPGKSAPALDREEREELALSLGVPATVLDDMLSKLGTGY